MMNKMLLKQIIREELKSIISDRKLTKINEGSFSELDIIAKESPSFQAFMIAAREEFPQLPDTNDTVDMLKNIYSQSAASTHKVRPEELQGHLDKMGEKILPGTRITVSQSISPYGVIEFKTKKDIEEQVFEKFVKFIEALGYNVDLGQSDRMYDEDPGERNYYPRIRFR